MDKMQPLTNQTYFRHLNPMAILITRFCFVSHFRKLPSLCNSDSKILFDGLHPLLKLSSTLIEQVNIESNIWVKYTDIDLSSFPTCPMIPGSTCSLVAASPSRCTLVKASDQHLWVRQSSLLTAAQLVSGLWSLTGGNWQKWKRVFLTCPCHEIYRDEAVGLNNCKNTWKLTIFVKMWNLGQYRENLIYCQ